MPSHWDAATWAAVISTAFTAVIATGVVFAWLNLRDTRRTRDAEIVQLLMERWDSPRMIDARRLIASYKPHPDAIQRMARDFKSARATQTGTYYLFTYHLNFWEQVGQAFGKNQRALKVISVMFGDNFSDAWLTWDATLKEAFPSTSDVGSAFRTAIRKVERMKRRKIYRHELWLWLFTPYYDTAPEMRLERRRDWAVGYRHGVRRG